jgi:predicted extracellular nuclease
VVLTKTHAARAAGMLACALAIAWAPDVAADVVVSEVYGGGGNSGATYRSDFIELRNTGAAAVSLDGWSVQYASSSGSSWQVTALSGSIAPGGFYLVKQADGNGGTVDLPTPDATGTIAMSGTNGKVALVSATTALSGTCPSTAPGLQDLVGFGSANCFEGSAATPTLSNTTSAQRRQDGTQDTDDNAADFTTGAPDPRNGGSPPPPPATPRLIREIQGGGLASPHVGEKVVTEGVVTALRFNNGFFLQAQDDDGDAATSEAIFVFTSSAPTVASGDRVRVTGTVEEYVPSSNRNQLSMTELVSPEVEVLEAGVPLPAARALDPALLSPTALPGTLEGYEAMRVQVGTMVVVAPSGGSIDENDARAFSDGVFHVTVPGVDRPFREPGIGAMDRVLDQLPQGKSPPVFDTNPERLMVRSRGQVGAQPLSVDTGATVDGLVGVLDYFAGTWALLPDAATPPTAAGGRLPAAVSDPTADEVTIAGFNMLRLFDDVADGNGAVTLTPEAVERRLSKAALAICDFLKAPDIVGVVEVENTRVLELLADRLRTDCAAMPDYDAHLVQGNDPGGINVGFLVNTRPVAGGAPRVEVVSVTQFGKDATLANPDGSTSVLNDRPPLRLRALVHDGLGNTWPVTVVNNHLRSLNGIDDLSSGSSGWSSTSERVRVKRAAQAAYLAALVAQMQQADPNENIVLVGDFNAFEFSDGYADVMGIIRGDPAAESDVLTWADTPITAPLVDGGTLVADPAQRYSYAFAGSAQTLDHVLVNGALLGSAASIRLEHARINADFGVDNFDDPGIAIRSSDHDPVLLAVRPPAFDSADLSATVQADSPEVRPGDAATFQVLVSNAGPGAADQPAAAFVLEDYDASMTVDAPQGWACAAPVQGGSGLMVACSTPSLASGSNAVFTIGAVMAAGQAQGRLRLVAAVDASTADPSNGNDVDAAEVGNAARADLSVGLQPSRVGNRLVQTFTLTASNDGPDTAHRPRIAIRGSARAHRVAVAPAQGWSCGAMQREGTGFRVDCSATTDMASGATTAAFGVAVVSAGRGGFDASVASATPDPVPGNNEASLGPSKAARPARVARAGIR